MSRTVYASPHLVIQDAYFFGIPGDPDDIRTRWPRYHLAGEAFEAIYDREPEFLELWRIVHLVPGKLIVEEA